jgi:putative transposase
MAKPYPMELRNRAVKFVQAGESRHAVASRLGLGAATVIRWLDRFEKTGTAAPSKFGGYRKPKIVGAYRDWLLERIERGDFTLQGLASELEGRGLKVDYKTVWKFVRREDLSFKKKHSRHRAAKT